MYESSIIISTTPFKSRKIHHINSNDDNNKRINGWVKEDVFTMRTDDFSSNIPVKKCKMY